MSTSAALEPVARRRLVDVLGDRAARLAVLCASRDPNAKVTVLVIPREARSAQVAIKVPTTAEAARAVAREARMLHQLHLLRAPILEATAPRLLELLDAGDAEALVVSALPGTPMTTLYLRWRHTRSPSRVAGDLGAVSRWLRRLHDETGAGSEPAELDGGSIELLRQRYGAAGPRLRTAMGLAARACDRLRAHRAPRTVMHGDLWCGNVLVQGGRVSGVIDWESAELRGEPLRDLARFALSYALYLDRHTRPGARVRGHPGLRTGEWGCGIDHLLFGDGWICDLLRTFLRLGMRRLGVPGGLWREAVIAGVAEVAARADDDSFGRHHLDVLARVARRLAVSAAA